jgi:16S rRNA (guanine1207-N2)-methyltransferase
LPPSAGHYFDPDPAARSAPATVALALPDLTVRLATDRGVFSPGAVDAGTRYLLIEAPPPAGGTVLDLGCGYGPVAVALALRVPAATVWAVDVNRRALDLCRANAEANGAANVVVAAPDDVPADLSFDAVWSNPPVRIGKPALHDLLRRWLGRLAPGGQAWLVVHKHLGSDSLARWLEAEGFPTERAGSRAGYRLLRVGPA